MGNEELREVVYQSKDKQYFDKNGDLVKTILNDGVIIDFSGRTKKVSIEDKSKVKCWGGNIGNDDIPF